MPLVPGEEYAPPVQQAPKPLVPLKSSPGATAGLVAGTGGAPLGVSILTSELPTGETFGDWLTRRLQIVEPLRSTYLYGTELLRPTDLWSLAIGEASDADLNLVVRGYMKHGAAMQASTLQQLGSAVGEVFDALNAVWQPISEATGAGVQQYSSMQRYANPTLATSQGLAGQPITAMQPSKVKTPEEALTAAKKVGGFGGSLAESIGLQPGTAAFQASAFLGDLMLSFYLDPFAAAGRVNQVRKLAERIPEVGAAPPVRGRIAALAAQFFSKTPEQIVQTGYGRKMLDTLWGEISHAKAQQFPKSVLYQRFPELGAANLDDLLAAGSRADLDEIIPTLLRGRLTTRTRAVLETRVESTTQLINNLSNVLEVMPGTGVESFLERAVADLASMRTILEHGEGYAVLRALPDRGPFIAARRALARPTGQTAIGRTWAVITDTDWVRAGLPARGKIPNRAISLMREDLDDAAKQLDRLGRLGGVPRVDRERILERFLDSTADEESYQAVIEMIKGAKKVLPPEMADELTMAFSGRRSLYGIDGRGNKLMGWIKKVFKKSGDEVKDTLDEVSEWDQPLLWSQRTRAVPLPDVRGIIQARGPIGKFQLALKGFSREGGVLEGMARHIATAPNWQRGAASAVATTVQGTRHAISAFTHAFWVPSVLFRLGWTARVVGDERLRMMAVGIGTLETPVEALARAEWDEIPERAMAKLGAQFEKGLPTRDIISKGRPRYFEGLRDTMQELNADPVIRNLARHGVDDTVTWLETGAGRQYLKDMKPIIDRIDGNPGARGWVMKQNEYLDAMVGGSPELRALVETGLLNDVAISNTRLLTELSRLEKGTLPNAVKLIGDVWKSSDEVSWRRFVAGYMELLGSKPTNALNRSKTYRFFSQRELSRLRALGVSDEMAVQMSRRYGIERVGEILYDATERTAFDVMVRNISPFFPAWKEVLTRWAGVIPAQMGILGGHAVIAERAKRAWDIAVEDGLVEKDSQGTWVLKAPGMDSFFSNVYGVEGLKVGIPVQSLNMLGQIPGGGPTTDLLLAKLSRGSERWAAITDVISPFGVGGGGGPRYMSRILRSWGITPPWEGLNAKNQDALDALSVADYMRTRTEDIRRIIAMPKETPEERSKYNAAIRQLAEDAEKGAAAIMFRRGLLGFFMPAQPLTYWPGEAEADRLREAMKALPYAEGRTLFDEFAKRHPEWEALFVSKTRRMDGEVTRDQSIDQFFNDLFAGKAEALEADEYAALLTGQLNYSAIRREAREQLVDVGTTADAWIKEGAKVDEIFDRQAVDIDKLREANPGWATLFDESMDRAARKQGRPLPSYEEEAIMRFGRDLRVFETLLKDVPEDPSQPWDLAGVRRALATTREHLDIDRFYSEKELAGPDKDYAEYFDRYYGPYWEEVFRIRSTYIDQPGLSAEQRSDGYAKLRQFRDNYKTPVINGREYPKPEEGWFLRKGETDRADLVRSWSLADPARLTRVQREKVGYRADDEAVRFWTDMDSALVDLKEWARTNGISTSSKDYRSKKEVLLLAGAERASNSGLGDEYRLWLEPPYKRAQKFGLISPQAMGAWQQITEGTQLIRKVLKDTEGRDALIKMFFYQWLNDARAKNAALDADLDRIQLSLPQSLRYSGVDTRFYSYLFLEEGP